MAARLAARNSFEAPRKEIFNEMSNQLELLLRLRTNSITHKKLIVQLFLPQQEVLRYNLKKHMELK